MELNNKAVDALVAFFLAANAKEGFAPGAEVLATALDIDMTADADTMEMGIRYALTKKADEGQLALSIIEIVPHKPPS